MLWGHWGSFGSCRGGSPRARRHRRALIEAAEAWSRQQGCTEVASDTWVDAVNSERAHLALGFEVVDRCIHFRKTLGP